MNRTGELYRLISKNRSLAIKRHPMFERNRVMKVLTYILIGIWAVYLVFFGVLLGSGLDNIAIETYDWLNGGFVIILACDFFMRFTMQETPAHDVKPYKLLPVPTNFLMNIFLIKIGTSGYNLLWHFFFVPFAFFSIFMTPYYGITNFIGYLIGIWLMFVINAYWYLLWKSFISRSFWYLICPTVIYAACIWTGIVSGDWFYYLSMRFMRGFITGNVLSHVIAMALVISLFFINRFFQKRFVYEELAKVDSVKNVRSTEMSFLNRFGTIGEYLKLEIKSTRRNPAVRKQFLTGMLCTVLFCVLQAFTTAYDTQFMKIFVCVYCFAGMGVTTMTTVMCVEGNYMDGLMSMKQSVLALLKAKYYFNCIIMLLPLLFCIMPVASGKLTVTCCLGSMFFTTGIIFPFLFQLAVYNNTCMNLNGKLHGSNKSSKAQLFCSLAALFVPMIIMNILVSFFDMDTAGEIMLAAGLAGTLLNPLWLRNIYERFMQRRYENMSGFRATR